MGSINYEAIDSRLDGFASNQSSQFGEDGLIAKVFEIMPPVNMWCLEVGASDGRVWSNTLSLRKDGWNAVLIEKDADQFDKLLAEFGDDSHCLKQAVTSLDPCLEMFDSPKDIDLVVIDIDGHDYWVWQQTNTYRPRVVLIEYCYWRKEPFLPDVGSAEGSKNQASEHPILALAERRGYTLVARTYCNLLFVDSHQWNVVG